MTLAYAITYLNQAAFLLYPSHTLIPGSLHYILIIIWPSIYIPTGREDDNPQM